MSSSTDRIAQTRFERPEWHARAMVRVRDANVPFPPIAEGELFFNPELTPYVEHELVRQYPADTIRKLSANRLADYLTKTEAVELEIVNRAVEVLLAMPDVPVAMRKDLLAIYTDEGYHTLMMEDFRSKLIDATGFELRRSESEGLKRIAALHRDLPPAHQPLAIVCCAIVTETLITATLRKAGAFALVYGPVATLLADHAADESRHHVFFAHLADILMPTLDPPRRAFVEELLPKVMVAFLAPETDTVCRDLVEIGLTREDAIRAVVESHDPDVIRAQMLSAATAPRRLFQRLGLRSTDTFEDLVSQYRISINKEDQ